MRRSIHAVFTLVSASLLGACGGGGGGGGESDVATTATFAFVPPGASIDLANYTLTSKHDLPVGSGLNLLLSEASAVTYDKDTDTLFLCGDHGTAITQVSKTGALIDSMQMAQDPTGPQGTYFYDTEGLTYVGSGMFVMVEERYRQIDRFTYQAGTVLGAAGAQPVKMGTTIGNVGIEGMSFDPFSGGFIFVKEKDPIGVFQSNVDFALGTATNGSAATVDSTNLFDPALLGVVDLADVFSLSIILPAAADYGRLLLLSQESARILDIDRAGTIHGRLDIPFAAQTEGLTMDQNRVLYLANELGGGAGKPQLWVYTPTTTSAAVGVGSHLYVTFDRPVTAGTGAIVLSNGTDVRTIPVGDAAQVTISGSTLKVNPAADLAPGTTYTVTVAAGVLKSPAGVALPALATLTPSLTFTTVSDTIVPTLESSNPADDAASVAGSHIDLTFSEPMAAGTGQIVLHSSALADDRVIQASDVTQVTIAGTSVDVNPTIDLLPGTNYYVTIQPTALVDLAGNPFAGISTTTQLNFRTAGSAPATPLAIGDVLILGINGSGTDAISFLLLKAINAGTSICFTDKNYVTGGAWPTNEAGLTWTAGRNYPAGTHVTINAGAGTADKGSVVGTAGGISTSAETYYAFIGTITNPDTGAITVDHFLAAINVGGAAAGDVPPELVTAGTYLTFAQDNAKYTGSFDESDLLVLSGRVKTIANWSADNSSTGFTVGTNGSMFQTVLAVNDLLFMGVNGNEPDAIAFVLLKAVGAGTQICFTDKDYAPAGTPIWPTNEAAYTWTADVSYPVDTIVTIQTNAAIANKGSVVGAGGGVSTSAETYYAFVGTIADPNTGDMTADLFLASINVSGGAAGNVPATLVSAGTAFAFAAANVKYNASLTDPGLAARVKDPANWISNAASGFPLTGGGLFP